MPSLRRSLITALTAVLLVPLPVLAAPSASAATTVRDSPRATASVNGRVSAVAYHGSTAYLGGSFTQATNPDGSTFSRHNAAAIDTRTGRLLSWSPNPNAAVYALAVVSDGVFVGGDFSSIGGAARARLAKVGLLTGQAVGGAAFSHGIGSRVNALAVGAGRLFVGGAFLAVDGHARPRLAALSLSNGALVAGWTPSASGGVQALAVGGSRLYVTGGFSALNGSTRFAHLAAVNVSSGATDSSFAATLPYRGSDVAVTSEGVYVATGGQGGHLRAFGLNGASRWTVTTDGDAQAVTVSAGVVYFGGHWDYICRSDRTGTHGACLDDSVLRRKLAAATTGGSLLSWAPNPNSPLGVFALDHDSTTGTLTTGGDFTTFKSGTVSQPHVAVFGH